MALPRLFTWQFSARQRSIHSPIYSESSSLISDELTLTIAGSDLKNARSQAFVPPKQLDETKNILCI